MKVIIIGAGLCGLATAIALRKHVQLENEELEVKIYEKSQLDPSIEAKSEEDAAEKGRKLGAAVNLQQNGLFVLRDLDAALYEKVLSCGYPCKHMTWKTSGDITLGRNYLNVLPISRPVLIECLQEYLPAHFVTYRTVSEVVVSEHSKPRVRFEDGTPDEEADLVVGADGIRSPVRHALFDEPDKYHPVYTGRCGVGGFIEAALPQHLIDDPTITFILGSTGTFVYMGVSQTEKNKLLYASFWDTDLPPRGQQIDFDKATLELHKRHAGWTDPFVEVCLQEAKVDNVWPLFVLKELPYWGRSGAIVLGDAAHAMHPRSGQGVSQAFEDAHTLALLLAEHLKKAPTDQAVALAERAIYDIRAPRVHGIQAKAMAIKEPQMPLSPIMLAFTYSMFFVITKLDSLLTWVAEPDKWKAEEAVKRYLDETHGEAPSPRRYVLPS